MQSSARPSGLTFAQAAVALVLFACIPVVVRYVTANPFTIGVVRLTIATTGLAAMMAWRRRASPPAPPLRRGDWLRLAVIGLIFFAHWITYFFAIKTSSASIGAIGLSTYGIHLLILGALFGRARFHIVDFLAVALAVAGAVSIVPEFRLANDVTAGLALAVLSGFFYATLPVLHQRWEHLPSQVRALGQFGFALLFFLLFLPRTDFSLRPVDWAGLAFLGVGSTFIGHTLWVRVTTTLPSNATSIIYYGNLPVALVLSVALLGEPITTRTLAGALLIVLGGVIGLGAQWKRGVA